MGKIINFDKKRQESIEKKRRDFERVVFSNLLGLYSVIDNEGGLSEVEILDISRTGLQLQVPVSQEDASPLFRNKKDAELRFYFTPDSYITAVAKKKRKNEHIDQFGQRYWRYGCEFDKNHSSFKALNSFIEFIHLYAEHSVKDGPSGQTVHL